MADIVHAVISAIRTTLLADQTVAAMVTGVYSPVAPREAEVPYIIIFPSAGREMNSSPRRAHDVIVTVKVVSSGSGPKAPALVDAAVDDALHMRELSVDGWGVYWCARETTVFFTEIGSGELIFHVGGSYRIRLVTP